VFSSLLGVRVSETGLAFRLIPDSIVQISKNSSKANGAAGLLFLMYGMVQISNCPNVDLCTLQNPLLAIAVGVPTDKGTMSIIEIRVLDSLPNIVHRIRWQGNLFGQFNLYQQPSKNHKPYWDTTT
jgi:hypothetical protein